MAQAPPVTPIATALADRYTFERELGRGGMATVYLAEEKKHGRKVAIKVLRSEITAALGTERFLREIGIAAQLSHPHIVPLIDSGEAGGLLYYVQPHVPGGSLRERLLEQRQLPVREALRIAQEVGAGLDFAHRKGFVHRDVKPENILFADGHAVLSDFGVARACCDADDPDATSRVTEVGIAVGTPEYMSPEQASGDTDLDTTSDVYSLACVVYEMLAGEPPFSGAAPRAIMAKHVTEMPRPIRGMRPDVPAAVERALDRALEKDPGQRFTSAAEFVAALAQGGEAPARTPTITRSIAVLPFVNASPDAENEYLSDGITDELIDALAKISGLRVASRTSVFALKGKPLDVRAVGALLGVSVVLEGTLRKAGDRLRITAQLTSTDDGRLLWSQRYDRKLIDVFTIQDEIARTIVSTLRATMFADLSDHIPRRYTENIQAYGLYLKGRYAWNKRTQEGVAEAVDYFGQAIAEDPGYAPAYAGLADSYALDVDYRSIPVADAYTRAKEYARKALTLDESLPSAHASLAWALFIYDWQWDEAEREFRRAIELNPRYASAHQWFAFLLAARGQFDAALLEAHTAIELDPASVSGRRALGWVYYYARRYDHAREHLSRAIEMNPMAVESARMLGSTLALQGQTADAERVLREALSLPGAGTYTTATLGWLLARSGKRSEAEQLLRELEATGEKGYVSPVAFAILHIGLGNLQEALEWAERAYDERRGWLAYVNVNPIFDPLRSEPRFKALVERMRL
ncbi:MAG TPA: protein kinase [Gemmatimonadales bacterium]|nr:protein kinase [Gemmatimonadales bacterium]